MKINNRIIAYIFALLFVQIFVLDSLSISVYVAPLIYIGCIIILPLNTPSFWLLIIGLLIGWIMDLGMGVVSLNLIATLPMAVFRRPIIRLIAGYEDPDNQGRGIPTPKLMGTMRYHRYIISMVSLHCLLFFGFEYLTFDNFWFFICRFLSCTTFSIILIYISLYIFNYNREQ